MKNKVGEMVNIEEYTGLNILRQLKTREQRDVFKGNYDAMRANYGENVDARLLDEQILMCDETYPVLYAVPSPVRYIKGSRPWLENYLSPIAESGKSETEKALAVMRICRDSYKTIRPGLWFYGGTEEEMLKKGEIYCECLARLFCGLCEVLGIPARIITHIGGGHLTAEVYADGKWGYIDSRTGMYFYLPDGRLASLKELCEDKSLLFCQSEEVRRDVTALFTYDYRIKRLEKYFLNENEVNTVKNYSLADAEEYSYGWMTADDVVLNNANEVWVPYSKAICVLFGEEYTPSEPGNVVVSLPDGAILREDISFSATFDRGDFVPHCAEIYIDGELKSRKAECGISIDDFMAGKHTLRAELKFSSGKTLSKEIEFFVEK